MQKENLRDYAIEDILKREPNKFKGLVIIMKETRKILKELFGTGIDSPGKKSIIDALKQYEKGEIEIRKGAI
ncbi:MAG: hypothetical protein ABIN20_04255 [candidate division WOR-3 bacterium]